MIRRVFAPQRRAVERANQRIQPLRILVGPARAAAEHLLRAQRPDGRRGGDDRADARVDRHAVPRLADAEAIDLPGAHRIRQERRRNHDQPHVAVRVDAHRGEPVAQLIVVAGERIHHAERERLVSAARARFDDASRAPCLARADRRRAVAPSRSICSHSGIETVMALPPSPSENGAISGVRQMPDAERRRDGHRPEHVRGIEVADDQPVADVRPRGLAHEPQVEAFGRREALLHARPRAPRSRAAE